ncbi:MAG TPA: hypothetical protein VEX41_08205 [Candidatus Eisenbacteria bacterium]|nr:hypothetical protein [Candidatus Eisenbacteria bacterium]
MIVPGGGIPGWAPVDERTVSGDPAYRPIGVVLREAALLYRLQLREILLASAAVEIPLTLLVAPYLAYSWQALAELWRGFPSFEAPAAYARYADPAFGAVGGLAVVTPIVAFVLVTAVVTGIVREAAPPPDRWKAVLRYGPRLAVLCALILGLGALLGFGSAQLLSRYMAQATAIRNPGLVAELFGLELLFFAAVVVGAYAVVRSAVAVPALVAEGLGLRQALGRSLQLTRRRTMRTALFLTVGAFALGLGNVIVSIVTFAVVLTAGSPDPSAVVVPIAGFYLMTRIVLAPTLPIIAAILYRDFRAAGPMLTPTQSA